MTATGSEAAMGSNFRAVIVRPMEAGDLDQVFAIERKTPEAPHWPRADYERAVTGEAPVRRLALVVCDAAASSEGTASEQAASGPRSPVSEILGFAVIRQIGFAAGSECELESIAVRPEAQGRGVGSALMSVLLEGLRQEQAAVLLLEVRDSNRRALHFYERWGFRRTGLRLAYYRAPVEDAVLMERNFDR